MENPGTGPGGDAPAARWDDPVQPKWEPREFVPALLDSPWCAALISVGLTLVILLIGWWRADFGYLDWYAPALLQLASFFVGITFMDGVFGLLGLAIAGTVGLTVFNGLAFFYDDRGRLPTSPFLVVGALQTLALFLWIDQFQYKVEPGSAPFVHLAQSLLLIGAFWKAAIDAYRKPALTDAFVLSVLFDLWLVCFSTPWDTPIYI